MRRGGPIYPRLHSSVQSQSSGPSQRSAALVLCTEAGSGRPAGLQSVSRNLPDSSW